MRGRATSLLSIVGVLLAGVLIAAPAGRTANLDLPPVVSGDIGWWASNATVDSMTRNSDVVEEVTALWWRFGGPNQPICVYDNGDYNNNGVWGDCLEGDQAPGLTAKSQRHLDQMRDAGIRTLVTIVSFARDDSVTMPQQLDDSAVEFADQIADWASDAGVAGVDISFFSLMALTDVQGWEDVAEDWQLFIRELSQRLHEKELLLSVTVPAGPEPFSIAGVPNPGAGYPVYSWTAIAHHVDRFRIRTSDFSLEAPGPIGPNNWTKVVAESAIAQIGKENAYKIVLESPQFGRNWPVVVDDKVQTDPGCPTGWRPITTPQRTSVTPRSAFDLADRVGAEPVWDDTAGEWTFTYFATVQGRSQGQPYECDIAREVWFADTRSASARATLVAPLSLGGISVWELGTVDENFYTQMRPFVIESSAGPFKLTAPPRARAGATVTLRAQFTSGEVVQSGSPATLWRSTKLNGKRVQVAQSVTSAAGAVSFKARVATSGYWWISTPTTFGYTWTAGPARIVATKRR